MRHNEATVFLSPLVEVFKIWHKRVSHLAERVFNRGRNGIIGMAHAKSAACHDKTYDDTEVVNEINAHAHDLTVDSRYVPVCPV